MSNKNTKSGLVTFKDVENVLDGFASEAERLRYMRKSSYKDMSIVDAFAKFYDVDLSSSKENAESYAIANSVTTIEIGKSYWGTVTSFTKGGITFSIPGVKDELYSKENFSDCKDCVDNYLLNHDNKLYFEVREKNHGRYVVSVINGYYNLWMDRINAAIEHEGVIDAHIDSLTKGGYLCHCMIDTLFELTGKNYTSSVFIPGSNIVLNIEHDFEKWIGEDVQIVPQKMVKFRKDLYTGETENSLIGSRKRVLQLKGVENLYNIYNTYKLAEKSSKFDAPVFTGTVTGMINSNKKTGVFVELDDKYITGLLPLDSSQILDYRPGTAVTVRVAEFEVQEGREPFVLNKKNSIVRCNTRCIFEIA